VFNNEGSEGFFFRAVEEAEDLIGVKHNAKLGLGLLRVCKQILSEAAPVYFHNQTFSYYKGDDDAILNTIDPFLQLWLEELGPGVESIRKLGVDVEDHRLRLQVKLTDGECLVDAWIWDWDGDEEMQMGDETVVKVIQDAVICFEKVVKKKGIKRPAAGPVLKMDGHPGLLPYLWSDAFEIGEE
jgi:hypothetical protein